MTSDIANSHNIHKSYYLLTAMVHPISLESYPPGPFILVTYILNTIFLSIGIPQWREYLPFGLGDADSNGWLSHDSPAPISTVLPDLLTFKEYLQSTNVKNGHNLSSVYKFAFQTSNTSLGALTTVDSMVVLFFIVLLLRKVKRTLNPLFSSVGRTIARTTHGVEWEKENEEKIIKFGEYVFRFMYHSLFSIYGVIYFWDKIWWDKSRGGTTHLWIGYPNQEIEPGMTWYYMLQSAYNVDAFISLVELSFVMKLKNPFGGSTFLCSPIDVSWSKTVRGDFREMMMHHIITNCLIFGSSYFRFTRIGSMIFVIHDVSDVPVDMSKLAHFVKWDKTTVVCFLTMVVVWIITRMTFLPFVIVKSVWYESELVLDNPSLDPRFYKMYFFVFMGLLTGITMLHYFWFSMFIKIAKDMTKGKPIEDHTEKKNK